jgi:hypothetical protein
VFEAVVRACIDAGLVKGEGFAVEYSRPAIFFAASIGVICCNAAVNTRAGTSLPVDKGAYGPILFRASGLRTKALRTVFL